MDKRSDLIGDGLPLKACAAEGCENSFPVTSNRRRYCSATCIKRLKAAARRQKREAEAYYATCAADDCERTFRVVKAGKKFCSDRCATNDHRRRIAERDRAYGVAGGRQVQRRAKIQERRQELIEAAGGACIRCQYSRCHAALNFHHRNPMDKCFILSGSNLLRAWDTILEEAAKCDLLCANCHVEEHDGEI